MLSRVANSLFWLGRYIERAENYARFIDVNFNLSIDLPVGIREQWQPLIAATGDHELFEKLHGKTYSREKSIFFLAFDDGKHLESTTFADQVGHGGMAGLVNRNGPLLVCRVVDRFG